MSKRGDKIADILDSNDDIINQQLEPILDAHDDIRDELTKKIKLLFAKYKNESGVIQMNEMQKQKVLSDIDNLLFKYKTQVTKDELEKMSIALLLVFNNTGTQIDGLINGQTFVSDNDKQNIINEKYKGKTLTQRITDNKNEMFQNIKQSILMGVSGGALLNQVVNNLNKDINKGTSTTMTVGTTEGVRVATNSINMSYQQNGVGSVRWETERDGHVCDKCKEREGNVYSLNEVFTKPPLHPHCRCILVPINR